MIEGKILLPVPDLRCHVLWERVDDGEDVPVNVRQPHPRDLEGVSYIKDPGCRKSAAMPTAPDDGTGRVRVLFLVCWPGVITPDSTSEVITWAIEWFSTRVKLSGASVEGLPLDGMDLFPDFAR